MLSTLVMTLIADGAVPRRGSKYDAKAEDAFYKSYQAEWFDGLAGWVRGRFTRSSHNEDTLAKGVEPISDGTEAGPSLGLITKQPNRRSATRHHPQAAREINERDCRNPTLSRIMCQIS